MHHRTLGRTGWIVSEVGYGAWGIGGNQWRGHREEESLAALRRALELGLNFIDTALAIYNTFDQSPELNLLPLCRELNIGVLARVPFDEGALTGAITPESTFDAAEFRAAGLDEPLPHTALRFILTHRAVSTVIPGMRRVRNVEENLAIPAKGALSQPILNLPRQHAWEKNFYGP